LNSVEYFKTAIYLAASEQVSKSKAILKFQNPKFTRFNFFEQKKIPQFMKQLGRFITPEKSFWSYGDNIGDVVPV